MSRKAIKKTHDLPSFADINDKMKSGIDEDDESTQCDDSVAPEPPYAEYGIMDNNFNNLPKLFFGAPTTKEDDETWQLPLRDGVMDQLSYQVAMRQALIDNSDSEAIFSFDIIDGDAIKMQQYRLVGEEILSTPLGELNTLKLERVREASDQRASKIWLAVDWNFLLTRIEQQNNSGLQIVLELKSAELNGEIVRADN